MSTTMTAAGESLVARLQAEGKTLIIDRMIFAHIPGQDHTKPIAPGVDVPTEPEGQVVHNYGIPPEYRAYVNPNQVVYSAMLGSDVGDFTFNWQGLYCTEHSTLVAVATFPALEKRKYDVGTGRVGNNLTRNFLLSFTGAREITALTISADVWQLDFTVRLLGMDERTRLSNFDLYGQGYFEGDGWLLKENVGSYAFTPGLGYVGGIRALLPEILPLAVTDKPKNIWLSVCLKPVGSDRVAEATAVLVDVGEAVSDSPDETGLMHYRQIVARVEEDGTVTDLRPKRMGGLPPEKVGAVPESRRIVAGMGLSGGGSLVQDVTLRTRSQWHEEVTYDEPCLLLDKDNRVYLWRAPSGPKVEGVGAKEPGKPGSDTFWLDYAASISAPVIAGGIISFSGSFGGSDGKRPIPRGKTVADEAWAYCDGTNGTPNLRDRFIVGALHTYPMGHTGGAIEMTPVGTVQSTTLTIDSTPAHNHAPPAQNVNNWGTANAGGGDVHAFTSQMFATGNTGGSGPHAHQFVGQVHGILPPYYALAYIMKL